MNPAEIVLHKFGSASLVAEACNIDVSRPYYWTYPKSKGGTDGLVPSKHHAPLLAKSEEKKLGLTPLDLIQGTSDLPNLNTSDISVNKNKSTPKRSKK